MIPPPPGAKDPEASSGYDACCCCGARDASPPIESALDRVNGTSYQLRLCSNCGVVYAEPRHAVSAEWYARAVPCETGTPAKKDWRFATFLASGPRGELLLDVGCGDGKFLELARESGYRRAMGFDQDPRAAQRAREAGLEVRSEDWPSFCRSQADGAFDVITLFDVLEHVPEPRLLLAELHRLLREGGTLAVTLPNALRPLPFGREIWDHPPHHFTRWTPASLTRFLEAGGFEIERCEISPLETAAVLDAAVESYILRPLLGMVKRIFFAASSDLRAPVSELCRHGSESGVPTLLPGKPLRRLAFGAIRWLGRTAFILPVAAGVLLHRHLHPEGGTCLFVLSRKRPTGGRNR